MFKWIRYLAVFLMAPAIAAASASASLSIVLAKKAPERAIQLPIVDANAYANLAADSLAFAQAGGGGGAADEIAARARQTFRSEPTNSQAISLLAFSKQLGGDMAAARGLYADALMLSQRDRLANLSLTEDASQRGQIAFILDRYDVLLRTGGTTSDILFSVLGSALREEAIVPHLEASLAKRPPWAEQFWLRVIPAQGATENLGKLRLRLLSRGIGNPAGNDAEIVRRLVDSGQYALAYQLFTRVAGKKPIGSALIRNAEFNDAPEFQPFDWATFSDARYSAEIDPVLGALVVFTENSSDTLVARQLLRLPRGRYAVQIRTRSGERAGSTPLSARIRCADDSSAVSQNAQSPGATSSRHAARYSVNCDFSWVEIWARYEPASQDSVPAEIMIEGIDLAAADRTAASGTRARPSGSGISRRGFGVG